MFFKGDNEARGSYGDGLPIFPWVVVILLMVVAPAVSAELPLSIESINLNGINSKTLAIKPGTRLEGTVTVSVSSSSFFNEHTAVYLPSWRKTPSAMQAFFTTVNLFEVSWVLDVPINIVVPDTPGTHYLLFCFDKKEEYEMFNELTMRTDEQIFENGRAIKFIVDPDAPLVAAPRSACDSISLVIDGPVLRGVAGHGQGNEFWAEVNTERLGATKDDALKITLEGDDPSIDLDFEILDRNGERRGFSGRDGSNLEESVVRLTAGETLSIHVYAFREEKETSFRLYARRISLAAALTDPSNGRSEKLSGKVDRLFRRAGSDNKDAIWFSIQISERKPLVVQIDGENSSQDLDVWIYDDLGNVRARSRADGSERESIRLKSAEPATYYIRVSSFHSRNPVPFYFSLSHDLVDPFFNPRRDETVPNVRTDSGLVPPVNFEITEERDFEGFFHVQTEKNFLVEVFTGWGEAGRIDALELYAPDGNLLWGVTPHGRGWEAKRITTQGPGWYRLSIRHNKAELKRGRINVEGLSDTLVYQRIPGSFGSGGDSLD